MSNGEIAQSTAGTWIYTGESVESRRPTCKSVWLFSPPIWGNTLPRSPTSFRILSVQFVGSQWIYHDLSSKGPTKSYSIMECITSGCWGKAETKRSKALESGPIFHAFEKPFAHSLFTSPSLPKLLQGHSQIERNPLHIMFCTLEFVPENRTTATQLIISEILKQLHVWKHVLTFFFWPLNMTNFGWTWITPRPFGVDV